MGCFGCWIDDFFFFIIMDLFNIGHAYIYIVATTLFNGIVLKRHQNSVARNWLGHFKRVEIRRIFDGVMRLTNCSMMYAIVILMCL